MSWRPPSFQGRNDLETLLASDHVIDWVRISTMLLGPPPPTFSFQPKHKSNAYSAASNLVAADIAMGADADDQENG